MLSNLEQLNWLLTMPAAWFFAKFVYHFAAALLFETTPQVLQIEITLKESE